MQFNASGSTVSSDRQPQPPSFPPALLKRLYNPVHPTTAQHNPVISHNLRVGRQSTSTHTVHSTHTATMLIQVLLLIIKLTKTDRTKTFPPRCLPLAFVRSSHLTKTRCVGYRDTLHTRCKRSPNPRQHTRSGGGSRRPRSVIIHSSKQQDITTKYLNT